MIGKTVLKTDMFEFSLCLQCPQANHWAPPHSRWLFGSCVWPLTSLWKEGERERNLSHCGSADQTNNLRLQTITQMNAVWMFADKWKKQELVSVHSHSPKRNGGFCFDFSCYCCHFSENSSFSGSFRHQTETGHFHVVASTWFSLL